MDFSDIFRIVNLATGVFMVLSGIGQYFPVSVKGVIAGIFLIIFGLATALLEFQIPPQTARYASFMFSFIGRGAFYLFIGAIGMNESWWNIVPGSLIMFVGVAYIALEFVPQIEPPANMRDADAAWGAEQV